MCHMFGGICWRCLGKGLLGILVKGVPITSSLINGLAGRGFWMLLRC